MFMVSGLDQMLHAPVSEAYHNHHADTPTNSIHSMITVTPDDPKPIPTATKPHCNQPHHRETILNAFPNDIPTSSKQA